MSGPLAKHAAGHEIDFEVVARSEGAPERGFVVMARRWVVERTFAWLKRYRRLVLDFERLAATVEGFIYVAMTRLLLNRFAPHS